MSEASSSSKGSTTSTQDDFYITEIRNAESIIEDTIKDLMKMSETQESKIEENDKSSLYSC